MCVKHRLVSVQLYVWVRVRVTHDTHSVGMYVCMYVRSAIVVVRVLLTLLLSGGLSQRFSFPFNMALVPFDVATERMLVTTLDALKYFSGDLVSALSFPFTVSNQQVLCMFVLGMVAGVTATATFQCIVAMCRSRRASQVVIEEEPPDVDIVGFCTDVAKVPDQDRLYVFASVLANAVNPNKAGPFSVHTCKCREFKRDPPPKVVQFKVCKHCRDLGRKNA